ncbi:putative short-chain dehydrogenase/reductase [Sphaerisporangium melleum]|uniref:Short-chain dehydrogenase/reductase n=1 Tax=Sphaerisporangium melleum TaxID=321316 RepID=A0A917VT94_9ACTN|nr:SDR family NAD(P)-dependent oxidoreductase [Sphaerisporangium melleum]GGL12361.1 putative short-chain dehydrogenase/reductase [Sphaerisporangium melleum]GII74474.1 putative short-chain dehydrogenase/reductase [Sphaerisporangium melleum]
MALAWSYDDIPDQTGRTTLITGASSGLGLVVAGQLARRGASVIMAVRDPAKGERVRAELTGDLEVRQVDLADLDSVRRFADRMHADGRHIDVLINNAGIGTTAPDLTPQGYERVFATNHLGPFALTGLLLDLFRPDHDPRVVAVGSNLYRRTRPRTDFEDLAAERPISHGVAYVKSKTAALLFGAELDRRLRRAGSPVRSFLAHPGMASTPMHDQAQSLAQKALLAVAKPLFSRPMEQGGLPLAFAATSPAARTGQFLGFAARRTDLRVHFDALVPPADDLALAERLWRLSEEATGVRYLDAELAESA